ncbi:MAG: Trx7/PDZ domain-containing (seleno)protein [Fuerstiella sp.]
MKMHLVIPLTLLLTSSLLAQNKTREQQVREDREQVTADGFWLYNDLPTAFAQARQTGKPILVGLRCIPCHECVKLDDDLVDTHPVIRPLLEQFICVRVVSTNGLDLSLFQFDTDQSFAMFMLNADRTIYGRFGTRSHRTEWFGDVSLKGLAQALQAALDLHKSYPSNKDLLAGKTGEPLEFSSPEKYPGLRDKFTDRLNYKGEVAKSCIHCHQIGDARRDFHRQQQKPIPERLLYPYPHPKSIGLILDPDQMATVKSVTSDSPAAAAGFRAGDDIEMLDGQPLLSIADVQWVLNGVDPTGTSVRAVVNRDGTKQRLTLSLRDGWRRADDITWRVSSWGLRRMVTGGLKLETLPDEGRKQLNIDSRVMALRAEHVGQYGKHAVARRAGFQKGDVIVAYDGQTDVMTPGALLAYGARHTIPGQRVSVTLLRDGKEMTKQLTMQN